jgi:low density lipoprotein-related protein 2
MMYVCKNEGSIAFIDELYCQSFAFRLLKDGKACEDIDECVEEGGVCSQYCTNTPGGFFCKCNETYFETNPKDPTGCKRLDQSEMAYLIFTNKYYVRALSVDGKNYYLLQQDLKNVVAIDYDVRDEMIYFADVSAKTIYRAKFDKEKQAEKEAIIRHDSHGLEGISVDWVGRKIYWLDRHSKQLEVAELNGTNRRTLKVGGGIYDPRAAAVHPGLGWLFYTDWQIHSYIGRIGMDGSNFSRILTQDQKIIWPNGLTVDFFSNKIFWGDAHMDYVAFADFDGKNRKEIANGAIVPHVFAMTIFDDTMYWTDWNKKAVLSGHKFRLKEDWTIMKNMTHRPYDIQVPYLLT